MPMNYFLKLKPAHQAFLLLLMIAILFFPIYLGLRLGFNAFISQLVYVVLIGTMAFIGAGYLKLQRWWQWILIGFPLAAWGLHYAEIPTEVYLISFLVTTAMYWSTNTTQVPFYPSRLPVWRQLVRLIPKKHHYRVIDIGSGLGDLTMYLAAKRPDSECIGIEIAPLPWVISAIRRAWRGSKAKFIRGNYHHLNFAEFDVVFAYLSPAAMEDLWMKSKAEMKSGALLVSYEFDIPGQPANRVLKPNLNGPLLYIWEF